MNIQKNVSQDTLRTVKESKMRPQQLSALPSSNAEISNVPDIVPEVVELTKLLKKFNLSGASNSKSGGIISDISGMAVGGRRSLVTGAVKVAAGAAATYGAYKIAQSVFSKPKPPTQSNAAKKGQAELKKLEKTATSSLTSTAVNKEPIVNKNGVGSRFADYLAGTFKTIAAYTMAFPERLAKAGSELYKGAVESITTFADNAVSGWSGAGAAPKGQRGEYMLTAYNAFRAQGLTEEGAATMVAQINRENNFNPEHLFGTHIDDANKKVNAGMISWQGSRGNDLLQYMKGQGLLDAAGKIKPGNASITAMSNFAVNEMKTKKEYNKSYKAVTSGGSYKEIESVVGDNYIRWRRTDPKYSAGGYRNQNRGYQEITALVANARSPNAAAAGVAVGEVAGAGAAAITGVGNFITPLLGAVKPSSGFGMRRHPILGYDKMHAGIDWADKSSPSIYASAAGEVLSAGAAGTYGNLIQIKHPELGGFLTKYAHLSSMNVRAGEQVSQGQLIGRMGNTGSSTATHLHFEIIDPKGNAINPATILKGTSTIKPEPKVSKIAPNAQANAIAKRTQPRNAYIRGQGPMRSSPKQPIVIGGKSAPARQKNVDSTAWYLSYLSS